MENEYQYVTYPVGGLLIEEGIYSIKQLEELIEMAKILKENSDKALKWSLKK